MLLIHKQLSTNKAHSPQRSRSAQAAATEDTVFSRPPRQGGAEGCTVAVKVHLRYLDWFWNALWLFLSSPLPKSLHLYPTRLA